VRAYPSAAAIGLLAMTTVECGGRTVHYGCVAGALNLDPEWGAIDLVEEIEQTFAIAIADEDAERCRTVGDLFNLIRAQAHDWDDKNGTCASSAVFYAMRRAIQSKGGFKPGTHLHVLERKPRRLFSRLRRETELRLPILQVTKLGFSGVVICLVATVALIATMVEGTWTNVGLATLPLILGAAMVAVDPLRLPAGIETVGDLVRRTVPLNISRFRSEGRRLPDIWTALVGIAADHGTIAANEITPDTFLMTIKQKRTVS
jgi:hypothetical protein